MRRLERCALAFRTLFVATSVVLVSCKDAVDPNPAGVTGTFTLLASPVSLEVMQGGEGEAKIGIVRTGGFTGSVALAVKGAPAGLTATISPSVTSGNTATLVVTTTGSITPGTATLTIVGSATDRADQTTATALEITPNIGVVGNVTLDFSACPAAAKPIWFVYQDGASRWKQIIGASDVYSFKIASSKGGYALVSQGSQQEVYVSFASQTELIALERVRCGPQTKAVSGTLAGLGTGDVAYVGLGGGSTDPEGGPATNNFTLTGVQAGVQDLIAYRSNPLSTGTERAIIRRDQNIANNGRLSTLDFTAAEAFAPATAALTVTGTASFSHFMSYLTGPGCSYASLYEQPNVGILTTMRGIPAAQQRATDFHVASAYVSSGTSQQIVSESFHTLSNRSIAMPAALPTPTITALPGGHKRLQIVVPLPPEYQQLVMLFFERIGPRGWVTASIAWLGGSGATLAFPDLSGATGWKSSFMPAPTTSVGWSIGASGTNSAGATGQCTENARFVGAYMYGSE